MQKLYFFAWGKDSTDASRIYLNFFWAKAQNWNAKIVLFSMTKRARFHCVRCVAITWSRNNCKKIHVSRNIADGAWCLLHIPERLNQFEWDALHLMQHRTKPSMDFPSPPNHRLKFFYAWTFAHGMADFLVTIKKFSCRWWWRHVSWWEDSRPLLISLLNWEGKARLGGEGCCLAIDPVVAVA